MERTIFVRMKRLFMGVTAAALAACTGAGSPEADLPDSAALAAPADSVAATGPIQTESVARAPATTPPSTTSPPARRTTDQSEPVLKQPAPPRDTRPSIPWPQDTLTLRPDTN